MLALRRLAMDMAQAETFLTLCEELHFGRTAQRLHVSQPRVSRLITILERQVGTPLSERTSRKVSLTPLGGQLRAELQPGYEQMQAALDHARRAAREATGQIRIGFTPTTEGPALARLMTAFEHGHPGCQIVPQEVPVVDPYTALRAGEIDVLVNWLLVDEPDLTAGPAISQHARVLAVAASHPLASRPAVSVEELAGQHLPRLPATYPAALKAAFTPEVTPAGKPIRQTLLVRSANEIWALVARGLIVHLTVASMAGKLARDDIVLVPVTDMPPLPLGLIWRTAHVNARIRALATVAARPPPRALPCG